MLSNKIILRIDLFFETKVRDVAQVNFKVNLKLLHMFVAVAENRSFRMAAEQLDRSLSAVIIQIKQLEEQVGAAIFHRTTRRVELTSEGERLLGHARRALDEWEKGLRQIRDVVDIQRGTLSIGCVPTVAATILPKALSAFETPIPASTSTF